MTEDQEGGNITKELWEMEILWVKYQICEPSYKPTSNQMYMKPQLVSSGN